MNFIMKLRQGKTRTVPIITIIFLILTAEAKAANPLVYIDSITVNPQLAEDNLAIYAVQGIHNITFKGHGEDTDGLIISYEWATGLTDTTPAFINDKASFTISARALPVGVNKIAFRVQDNAGLWSETAIEYFIICSKIDDIKFQVEGLKSDGASPATIKLSNGAYRMYYNFGGIGLSISSDCINWEAKGRVINTEPAIGQDFIINPAIIQLPGGDYRLIFEGIKNGENISKLFSAYSPEGSSWTKVDGFLLSGENNTQNAYVSVPEVISFPEGKKRMYYTEYGSENWGRIKTSISFDNAGTWNKENLITGLPEIAAEPDIIIFPDGKYRMYYREIAAGDPINPPRKFVTNIASAKSENGLNWTREGVVLPYVGGDPDVVRLDNGGYRMHLTWTTNAKYFATAVYSAYSPNSPPVINNVITSGDKSITVKVEAGDYDGDILTYHYDITGGNITGSGSTVAWTVPVSSGEWTLTVRCYDGYAYSEPKTVKVLPFVESPEITGIKTYPNPAPGGNTTFRAAVKKESDIELIIYNTNSEVIKSVPSMEKTGMNNEGYIYEYKWSGKNNSGEKVSSGIYLICLIAKSGKATVKKTGKFVVLR